MIARRAELTDFYVEGSESIAMVHDQVLVMSPLATAILEFVGDEGVLVDRVADLLEARFGPPGRGTAAESTAAAMAALVKSGVLVLEG